MKKDIRQAASHLKQGHLVVYPTDTLYALGGDVFNEDAVRSVFNLKHRPLSQPIPVAVASTEQMEMISILTKTAKRIIAQFLPGTVTVVVEKKPVLSDVLTGGKNTVAIRIPNDPLALQLLKIFGPITVTSANIHNKSTPFHVNEIKNMFSSKEISYYIDDGTRNGKPSTIVDCTTDHPKILREGSISPDDIFSKV